MASGSPASFREVDGDAGPGGGARSPGAGQLRPCLHVLASDIAREEPFAGALAGTRARSPCSRPRSTRHSSTSWGSRRSRCGCRSTATCSSQPNSVVEWVKGTLLTDYENGCRQHCTRSSWPGIANACAKRSRPAPVLLSLQAHSAVGSAPELMQIKRLDLGHLYMMGAQWPVHGYVVLHERLGTILVDPGVVVPTKSSASTAS